MVPSFPCILGVWKWGKECCPSSAAVAKRRTDEINCGDQIPEMSPCHLQGKPRFSRKLWVTKRQKTSININFSKKGLELCHKATLLSHCYLQDLKLFLSLLLLGRILVTCPLPTLLKTRQSVTNSSLFPSAHCTPIKSSLTNGTHTLHGTSLVNVLINDQCNLIVGSQMGLMGSSGGF